MKSAEAESQKRWIWFGAVALILAGVAVSIAYVEGANTKRSTSEESAFEAFDAPIRTERSDPSSTRSHDAGGEAIGSGEAIASSKFEGTIVRPPPLDADSANTDPADAGGQARSDDVHRWQDPTNQRVLGRKQWMAQAPDAVSEQLDEELEKERPPRYPIDLQVRQSGVDIAKAIVTRCYEELVRRNPQADGRLAVGYNLVADGEKARFKDVDILVKVRLKDVAFDDCVLGELSRASFPTSEQGVMWVEYPLVFED